MGHTKNLVMYTANKASSMLYLTTPNFQIGPVVVMHECIGFYQLISYVYFLDLTRILLIIPGNLFGIN